MRVRPSSVLRDEHGQSVVLFVLTTTALMGLVALVINVGNWLQSQRHIRSVADATVLEAAQGDHDTFSQLSVEAPAAAQDMATLNWEGSMLSQYQFFNDCGGCPTLRAPEKAWLRIQVTTQHEVGYLAQNILSFLGIDLTPLTFSATAETKIDSPTVLRQVAPIAIACGDAGLFADCESPYPGWDGSPSNVQRTWPPSGTEITFTDADTPIRFEYKPGDPENSTFLPIERIPGATVTDLGDDLQACDPIDIDSSTCDQTEVSTESGSNEQVVMDPNPDPMALPPEVADAEALRNALQSVGSWPHLVTVYDTYDGSGEVEIIGFAAFEFELAPDDPGVGAPVRIHGTFQKMFFDAATLDADGTVKSGSGQYDFGVRSIALSG